MIVLGKKQIQNRTARPIHISTGFDNLALQVILQLKTA